MATRTSVGTGAWSAAGTWDTGVPADTDDVVIAAGHTVTFDVDQSSFTTGIKVTITGTLNHTTTAGVYCLFLKTGAAVLGAGTWNIGTSGTPIPFAAKHTITGAAGWQISGTNGLTMTVYGAEPSIKYVRLSGAEAIGQTELGVDTNVTGDIWAVGDSIAINNEIREIAAGGIAAGAITVTAGLTAAKIIDCPVALITRNIKFISVGTTNTVFTSFATAGQLDISSGQFTLTARTTFTVCPDLTISGGTFVGLGGINTFIAGNSHRPTIAGGVFVTVGAVAYNITNVTYSGGLIMSSNASSSVVGLATITGGVFYAVTQLLHTATLMAIISGGSFENGTYAITTGSVIKGGTFTRNATGFSGTSVAVSGATVSNNTNGISGRDITVSDITFTGNTNDLTTMTGKLFGVEFTGTTEHNTYTSLPIAVNCQSEDHDGNDGALKAWCKGGVVTSQTSVKPAGYTQAYLLDPESAIYPVFFTKQFSAEPGKTVAIEVQLRKDASMTYLPRVYLMASIGNPLAGATAVDSFTMTDSTDTWETDTFSISNTTDYDQDYTLWFVAQNASDNAYAAYDITTEGGSGGAVRILPFGGIGL